MQPTPVHILPQELTTGCCDITVTCCEFGQVIGQARLVRWGRNQMNSSRLGGVSLNSLVCKQVTNTGDLSNPEAAFGKVQF